jgi:hypothetical protein
VNNEQHHNQVLTENWRSRQMTKTFFQPGFQADPLEKQLKNKQAIVIDLPQPPKPDKQVNNESITIRC